MMARLQAAWTSGLSPVSMYHCTMSVSAPWWRFSYGAVVVQWHFCLCNSVTLITFCPLVPLFTGELRSAVLAVLQAYIKSYLSRPSNSLNALMQQAAATKLQADAAEADHEGSVAHSGVTRKSKALRAAGSIVGGYAASIGSYAASTTNKNIRAALAAASASGAREVANRPQLEESGTIVAPPTAYPSPGNDDLLPPLRSESTPDKLAAVAFAGDITYEPSVTDHRSAAAASVAANTAVSGRAASGAGSIAGGGRAGSVSGGDRGTRYAGSVVQGGRAASTAGTAAAAAEAGSTAAAGPDELNLHGVMLLCREVGLVDNITEHLDITRYFELMLHRKRGRLGPSCRRAASPGPAATATTTLAINSSTSMVPASAPATQEQCLLAPGQLEAGKQTEDCSNSPQPHEPEVIRVVQVVRPGQPAAADVAARASSSDVARLGSPSIGSRAGLSSAGVLNVETLDAEEVLELLLLVSLQCHIVLVPQPVVCRQHASLTGAGSGQGIHGLL